MKLVILNSAILTNNGMFWLHDITLAEAKDIVEENKDNLLSAVGHQSTADILTELLEIKIPVNRIQFKQEAGQGALVFKLKSRAPEGKILTKKQIEEIGYEFKHLYAIEIN